MYRLRGHRVRRQCLCERLLHQPTELYAGRRHAAAGQALGGGDTEPGDKPVLRGE